jgi:ABC-type transport system substrate-binding protein
MVMEQVWPQAFVIDPDYEPETTGFIDSAEVVSLSPMTVTYDIDPKAVWSDGVPITAADFEYNWHEQLSAAPWLALTGALAAYRDIESVSGTDGGRTVTVVFKSPCSDWEGLFADLVPAHVAERHGWAAAFAGFHPGELISGGPFIVSSYVAGKDLTLTRNPRYWGPPAHIARIVFLVEHSPQAALDGLKDGSVSIAEITPSPQLDAALVSYEEPDTGFSVVTTPSQQLWQLVFNLDDPGVANRIMRMALARITDVGQLVADSAGLDNPFVVEADSRLFAPGEPAGDAEPASPFTYNPPRALALFKLLGYTPDAEGVLRAAGSGSPLTFTITGPKDNSVIDTLELQLQAEWASNGVRLVIHNVTTFDLLRSVLPQGDYQLAVAPFLMPAFPTWSAIDYTGSVVPAPNSLPVNLGLLGVGGSGSVGPPLDDTTGNTRLWSVPTAVGTEPGAATVGAVTRDVMGLRDPEVAAYYNHAIGELNTSSHDQIISALDVLLDRELPTLPLYEAPVSLVQQSSLVNVSESPGLAGPLWDAEDWAIELMPPGS